MLFSARVFFTFCPLPIVKFFFISDNIRVKIVTSKDGFDKMGKGKNANLLSDEQATDFKDLLLGFLVRFFIKNNWRRSVWDPVKHL